MSKMIIFDFDGTLYDPIEAIHFSLNTSLIAHNLDTISTSKIGSFIGPPLQVSLKRHFNLTDSSAETQLLRNIISVFREHHLKYSLDLYKPYPKMLETIEHLSNNFELHIASSKPQHLLNAITQYHRVSPYFKSIIGPSPNDSSNLSSSKIHLFKKTLQCSRLDNKNGTNVIVIGDRCFDIDAANEIGAISIGALWGYGTAEEIESSQPTYTAKHFLDLRSLIKEF